MLFFSIYCFLLIKKKKSVFPCFGVKTLNRKYSALVRVVKDEWFSNIHVPILISKMEK